MLKEMRERISTGKIQMATARELITKLKKAGEDVSSLEKLYAATKARLDRYEKAFGT